jgi:long-chain acyl-CoA synthetase
MDKVWLKNYDPDVPHTIDPDQYSSIADFLEECFAEHTHNPCFTSFGESLSFQQIDTLSQTYAGFLQNECKLVKGDRVAIMMPNLLQYAIALFGALRAGMVNVNISPLYTVEQTHHALKETGAKCILVLANFAHIVEKAIPDTDVQYVVVTEIGDLLSPIKGMIFNFVAKHIKKMVPAWNINHAISFKQTLNPSYRAQFAKPTLQLDDLAYLQFTEGRATGIPKCAMLTHRNFVANGLQFHAWIHKIFKLRLSNGVMMPLPFFKLISISGHSLPFMKGGMNTHLIANPRDPHSMIKVMKSHPIAIMSGIRTIFSDLLHQEAFNHLHHENLKFVFSGGMNIPQALADRWQSITRSIIIQSYVLTEGSPLVIVNPLSVHNFTDSMGLPLPSTEVKICDNQDQELSFNMPGEIWIRGPQVIKSYWNNPTETKRVVTQDGWLKTGDIGRIDEKGFVTLTDRKEDIIMTVEGYVYPSMVENAITEIASVEEAVVVNTNDHDLSPHIKAFIIRSDHSITDNTILEHCRRHLLNFQVPHEIEFCETLPRSATGYILRRALKGKK